MRARVAAGAGVLVVGTLGASTFHSILLLLFPRGGSRDLSGAELALAVLTLVVSGASLTGAASLLLDRLRGSQLCPATHAGNAAVERRPGMGRLPADIPTRQAPPDSREFEEWCAARLHEAHWDVRVVGGPGDLGVDIRASRGADLLVVQCKALRRRAGIASVQQVFAGGKAHGASRAAVVCTAGFTSGARTLAAKIGVQLVLPHELENL